MKGSPIRLKQKLSPEAAAAKKRSKNLMKKSGGYLGVGKATKGYGAVRKV